MKIEFYEFDFSCSGSIPVTLNSKIHFMLSLYAEVIKSLKIKMTDSDL